MGTHEGHDDAAEPVSSDDLVRFAGGELTPAEEEQLRVRIARDPTAQQRLEQMRSVDAWFPPPPPIEVPPGMPDDMADRIRARIRREVDRIARGEAPAGDAWNDDDFDPEADDEDP